MGKGTKNFDPSSMVDDQQQETSSSVLNDNEGGKRQYTWADIRRHSSKKDRWIVINKRVYDITKWLKHPGGQVLLNHYAGQDATVSYKINKKSIKYFLLLGSISRFSSRTDTCSKIS
jgi:cytochrome b involved in lipid metabolism